jgi:hypothetical protein
MEITEGSGIRLSRCQPADGLHGGLGVLRAEDRVITISKGGIFCGWPRRARKLANCRIISAASPDPNSPPLPITFSR